MNRAILSGRLTRDPYAGNGVAKFSLAVERKYKQDGQPDVDFINCVAFGKTGEFVNTYLKKGAKVMVEGRITTGSYTTRDGYNAISTDIVVDSVEFAESKKADLQQERQETKAEDFMEIDIDDDSLPFN